MPPAVKLTDLTDALDCLSEETKAWLDLQTGRVVMVEDEVMRIVEEDEDRAMPAKLPDWRQEQVPAARAINACDKRYVAAPTKFDFHEYRHMERFIGTVTDARFSDQLWRAIKGKGAFRHFKDTAGRLGLLDDWFRYVDDARTRFVLDWAEANGVTVDQTPGGHGIF